MVSNKKIKILYQERHVRLETLIQDNITSFDPVLIYCPIATGLQRLKLSNIYIAPDTKGKEYVTVVEKIIEQQNQIYYPIYLKLKRIFYRLFRPSQKKQFRFEYIN